ncbi:carboxymuconolactone decarboxylase family protein [Albimonas pacifica]|uniref:Alkylhydroperoxidase AhpD family core domain-containing protein n=1 Tax=Albimonas pacifica TaxID=1114924 RepID=A0A1I3BNZ7_9RHOB|nr:carboxymuconolactone decarboxylase family protein [Albimonas pacifica]SFH64018.1 alkylhydroperoxidase AhpD family core domain-containing protein [Albimonas pacifica]
MQPRMTDYFKRTQPGLKALIEFEKALRESPLDAKLLHLVKLRASQINGCAACIHLHVDEALKDGESHARLHMLAGWRESPWFDAKERAALAWTEALTLVARTGAPDEIWAEVEAAFDPDERAWLSFAIGAINLWNRVQIGFRAVHPDLAPGPQARAA